jgi:hypothetical protein
MAPKVGLSYRLSEMNPGQLDIHGVITGPKSLSNYISKNEEVGNLLAHKAYEVCHMVDTFLQATRDYPAATYPATVRITAIVRMWDRVLIEFNIQRDDAPVAPFRP